jgi:CheY-like chemotaxis protein
MISGKSTGKKGNATSVATSSKSSAVILHVEDEVDDAFFVARAFGKMRSGCAVLHVKDGPSAIDYLSGDGKYANREDYPLPDLLLLDLKLPVVSGFEVMEWARSQPLFKELPIIILSGSPLDGDRVRAKALGALAYFVKTATYEDVAAFTLRFLSANPKSNVLAA